MVTKMRKSMIIVAFAVIICLIVAALSVDLVRNAYAAEQAEPAVSVTTGSDTSLGDAWTTVAAPENEGRLVKITLGENAELNGITLVLSSDIDVIVDLAGHSIAKQYGVGSVFEVTAGSLTLVNSGEETSEISGNTDNNVALLDVQNATLVIDNVNLTGNTGFAGGAINVGNSKVNVSNCEIKGNNAQRGAGVNVNGLKSDVTLDNVVISNNSATVSQASHGAGISVANGSKLTIKDSEIKDNTANYMCAGVAVSSKDVKLEGKVIIENNTVAQVEKNLVFTNSSASVEVGKLSQGSQIGVTDNNSSQGFALSFAKNNADKYGLPLNPAAFFKMDDASKKVALNSDGNVCAITSDKEVEWTVTYKSGANEKVNGYGLNFVYGEKVITGVSLNGGANVLKANQTIENVNRSGNKVLANVVICEIDGKTLALNVLITPKNINEAEASLVLTNGEHTFNGMLPEINTSLAPEDYTISDSGVNVSNYASITLAGRGNYSGAKVLTYKIVTNNTLKYTVEWQVNDNGWKKLEGDLTFGVDYTSNVRAKLTIERFGGGYAEYVYAQGVTPEDGYQWNRNLEFTVSGAGTTLLNVGSYTATIGDNGNVGFEANTNKTNISIAKASALSESDFGNATDSKGNSLWKAYYGDDDTLNYVTNDTPNAMDLIEGAYARLTGNTVKLLLNGSYLVGDKELKAYLDSATIVYTNNEKDAVGNFDAKAEIELSATNFNSATKITLNKAWEIKQVNNALRTSEGNEVLSDNLGAWRYGENSNTVSFRPEHGNTVIITVSLGGEAVKRFAIVYGSDEFNAAVKYYEVKENNGALAADLNKEIKSDNDYYNDVLAHLQVGSYTITAYVPAFTGAAPANHWWDGSECEDAAGTKYDAITQTFKATVSALTINAGNSNVADIAIEINNVTVVYNGNANNTPEIVLRNINGIEYVQGVDFELTSENKNVGIASFTVVGKGGLTGSFVVADSYEIVKAQNSWVDLPNVMDWTWKSYNREVNLITGKPELLDDAQGLWFKVTTDREGSKAVNDRLAKFYFSEGGFIEGTAADALVDLPVGTYYLFAVVDGTDNYFGLSQNPVTFTVFQAHNHWNLAPSVTTWVEGSFSMINLPQATPAYGTAQIIIYADGDEENVIYDSLNGINKLDSAPAGTYTLKALVVADVDGNFTGLDFNPVNFNIFQKAGLPWWAVVVLIVCSLGIAALIIFILIKAGVLRILTNKLTVAIRTKATIDATIAAVRAHKMQEEGKKSVAAAKARERAEQRKQEREADLARPIEERAKDLELKAQQEAQRAERIRARAAKMHEQVASMREQAQDEAAATTDNSTDK